MILIKGDTHGDIRALNTDSIRKDCYGDFPDFVIVCGDFGFIWKSDAQELWNLDRLEEKPFKIIVIKGNHENHERLLGDEFPSVDFYGAKAKQIRKNIFVIEHGEIFTIENKKFFCFGGATSIDKLYRKNRIEWWEEEVPNGKDYWNGIKNLEKYDNNVDFVISHTCPRTIYEHYLIHRFPEKDNDPTANMLDQFYKTISYKGWFCGHYHFDLFLKEKDNPFFYFSYHKGYVLEEKGIT